MTDFTTFPAPRLFATHFARTLLPACMSSCKFDFMGKPITMEEEKKGVVREITNLCSFKNLSNLEVNKKGVDKFGKLLEVEKQAFFRKGEIGDWKNYLSEEMQDRIDGIIEQKFQGSCLIDQF
ncbi:hypothetical protein R6Q59_018233 [Mikania micrantha]